MLHWLHWEAIKNIKNKLLKVFQINACPLVINLFTIYFIWRVKNKHKAQPQSRS